MNNIGENLEYWRKNAEEDYLHVPISVLKYISELEMEIENRLTQKDITKLGDDISDFIKEL
jgi:hypothetical protein